jgi:hypothetical protein
MRLPGDPRQRLVVALLVVAAVVGYLVGHHQAGTADARPEAPLSSSTLDSLTGIVLEHPATWRRARVTVAGEAIGALRQPLVLAPNGQSSDAGVVVGLIGHPINEPLPPTLLRHVMGDLRAEVVLLVAGEQAYRYSGLVLSGSGLRLTAYSIPGSSGRTVVLLCYAKSGDTRTLRESEQIAEAVTLPPQDEAVNLTEDAHFASVLKATLATLTRQRAALRLKMRAPAASSTLALLATRMAEAFAAAQHRLSDLGQLPQPGTTAERTLLESLAAVQRAYASLAEAAASAPSAGYMAASSAVYQAESNLQGALNGLSLLGY